MECQDGLWGMGSNTYTELGIESKDKFTREPVRVKEGKVDHFVCGFRQSYMIANDSLLGCGESRKFELGVA